MNANIFGMSFDIYAEDNMILLKYSPQKGTTFLCEKLDFDFTNLDYEKREFINSQDSKLRECNFETLESLASPKSAQRLYCKHYSKNGIKLLKHTISSKILDEDFNIYDEIIFILGILESDYYRIPKYLIDGDVKSNHINFDVLLHRNMKISKHTFIGDHGLNFFQIINEIRPEKEIIIGGDRDSSIPETDFDNIKKELPTKHGYQQYMKAKIEAAFSNYFDYAEDNWQKEINNIILILFPPYIGVLNKVITRSPSGQRKEIDLALPILP
jgi:hypothetical protein